ncbi:MAG: MCE family protein, partial [Acidimicrobiia bacterium]|nr:MCE family protein [Acidimicrobiia bacterium]
MTRMRGALVGAFVLGGLLLFGGGLFLIGDRRLMFTDQFEIWSSFGKVTGLQVGTRVRLAGLDAGEVLEVRLPSRPSERFRVRMRLREDVRQLVRADSTCAVQTDGLVGNAFLQVSVGTDDAAPIQPGDTIDGIDPVDIADLIQEGRGTFRTVTAQMVTLREDVSDVIASLTDTIRTTDEMIGTVGGDVRTMTAASVRFVEDLQAAAGEARDLVGDVRRGEGTIGQLLTDRTLYEQLTRIGGEAEQTARNVQETSDRVRQAVEVFAGSDGTAAQITQTLRNTLAEVQEVTSDLAEGTEALKRNFLFRGFFRDRGFFDLDTVSQEAYQAGVLEGADRTALRIWIDGAALFASNADGTLRLTPEGQRRLNSAMADLVRYPRDSPLVIEGYAAVNEGDAPYLLSSDRATLVRDYILGRFRRQATMTGIMPLGSTAAGSPGGDGRWSGVALALFVR